MEERCATNRRGNLEERWQVGKERGKAERRDKMKNIVEYIIKFSNSFIYWATYFLADWVINLVL